MRRTTEEEHHVASQTPIDAAVLQQECDRLLNFGHAFPHPLGGAAWLDEDGRPDLTRPVHLYITARMAHVYALGHLLGHEGAAALADAALDGLRGPLHDDEYGGWFAALEPDGTPVTDKSCYAHAFVVLAASSGVQAGRPGAAELLADALEVWTGAFWEESAGMFADAADRSLATLDPYRGVNANMHSVEALLAAYDATGDRTLLDRALGIAERVVRFARHQEWRIPEHFDRDWRPMLEHNRERPDDQFQPYGATVGHGLEWSRLLLHVEGAVGAGAPPWLVEGSAALFDRAVADGWSVDGADGFVYTTDWDGRPVVRDRMHWVLAEGFAAANALNGRTGDDGYLDLARIWWDYAEVYLLDFARGSWHHQLDPSNRPTGTVWPGKPDLYHAVQATLVPRCPLAPGMGAALAGRAHSEGSAPLRAR
jgi:sulfoquinovose isomerase